MSRVVTFHYTLRDTANHMLDTSIGGEPITYLEGAGQIIPGLESQLASALTGTQGHYAVPAADAYGARDESQVQTVKRALLPVEGDLKVGDQFRTGEDLYAPIVTVVSVEGDDITLDANHPLAGVDLQFEVEVVSAREATPSEVTHGHVHDADNKCVE